jgi:hypothetical protein
MTTKPEVENSEASLDPLAVDWLYNLASSNFKAQADLDESVWRSLSFIAALFALSVAVFRGMEPHLQFHGSWPEWIAGSFYILGIGCFVLSFGFLVWIVWEREFLHPAKDGEVKRYALELTLWHRSKLRKKSDLGETVVNDLQSFMVDLLVKANDRNLPLITRRLVGRSRAIILMLAGFAFLCASEGIIFMSKL